MSDTLQLFPSNETCCPPRGDVQELALIVMGEGVGLSTVRLQDRALGFGDRDRRRLRERDRERRRGGGLRDDEGSAVS